MKRGVAVFRRLEEERLGQLCAMSTLYYSIMENNRPKLVSLTERLREPIDVCDVGKDVQVIKKNTITNNVITSCSFSEFED